MNLLRVPLLEGVLRDGLMAEVVFRRKVNRLTGIPFDPVSKRRKIQSPRGDVSLVVLNARTLNARAPTFEIPTCLYFSPFVLAIVHEQTGWNNRTSNRGIDSNRTKSRRTVRRKDQRPNENNFEFQGASTSVLGFTLSLYNPCWYARGKKSYLAKDLISLRAIVSSGCFERCYIPPTWKLFVPRVSRWWNLDREVG